MAGEGKWKYEESSAIFSSNKSLFSDCREDEIVGSLILTENYDDFEFINHTTSFLEPIALKIQDNKDATNDVRKKEIFFAIFAGMNKTRRRHFHSHIVTEREKHNRSKKAKDRHPHPFEGLHWWSLSPSIPPLSKKRNKIRKDAWKDQEMEWEDLL